MKTVPLFHHHKVSIFGWAVMLVLLTFILWRIAPYF